MSEGVLADNLCISDQSENFGDPERSFAFRGHLLVVLGFEVPRVEPNQLV